MIILRNLSIYCILIFIYGCTEKHPLPETIPNTTLHAPESTPAGIDTNQYLYDFIRMVEKDQKLNYSYGLTLEPNHSLSTSEDDSYLWRFLKKTTQPIKKENTQHTSLLPDSTTELAKSDSVIILNTIVPFTLSTTTFSNSISYEYLMKADIKYMLTEKNRLRYFMWDNKRLGFNLSNTKNWYVFSLPYFSKDKKTVLISIRSLCDSFLCGSGYVLLYRFENNKWTSTQVDSWIH